MRDEHTEHNVFSQSERALATKFIHQVKDQLMDCKGFMVTPVHYAPRFHKPGDNTDLKEQYGCLQHRSFAAQDRRGVLFHKYQHVWVVDFHVDYGVLQGTERADPIASLRARQATHQTGLKEYLFGTPEMGLLVGHIKDYLLDGFLPIGTIKTSV